MACLYIVATLVFNELINIYLEIYITRLYKYEVFLALLDDFNKKSFLWQTMVGDIYELLAPQNFLHFYGSDVGYIFVIWKRGVEKQSKHRSA